MMLFLGYGDFLMIDKIKKINPIILATIFIFSGILIVTFIITTVGFSINAFANDSNNPFNDKFIVSDNPYLNSQQQYNTDDIPKQIEKEMEMIEKQMQSNHSMFSALKQPLISSQLNNMSPMSQINSKANNRIVVEELNDKYIVTINMQDKEFDDNAIKVNVEPTKINIQLNETINKDHYKSSSSIIKTLAFSDMVDTSKVTRSNEGKKHIVTIPKL